MDLLLHTLRARDGVARTGELLDAGVSKHAVQAAVAAGLVVRPVRGVIALPDADPVLVRCMATNSLLTCVSAAKHHGLWVLHEPENIHVVRGDGRFTSERAVIHRRRWAAAPPGSRVASLVDVALHALHCLPELEALVLVESAVNQGLPLEFLRARLSGPRNGRARAVLDLIDSGADSLAETLARTHLRRAGFHVEAQVEVPGVGSMDLIVERCLDFEADGKTHQEPESRYRDYTRDANAQGQGFATLRVGYAEIVYRPDRMVATVGRVVARRLAQGRLPVY